MAMYPGGLAVPDKCSVLFTSHLLSKNMAWAVNSIGILSIDEVVYLKKDKLNGSSKQEPKGRCPSEVSLKGKSISREIKCSNITDQDMMTCGEFLH